MTLTEILNIMHTAKQNTKGLQLVTDTNTFNLSNIEVLQISSIWKNPREGFPTMTDIVLPDKTTIDVKKLVSAKVL